MGVDFHSCCQIELREELEVPFTGIELNQKPPFNHHDRDDRQKPEFAIIEATTPNNAFGGSGFRRLRRFLVDIHRSLSQQLRMRAMPMSAESSERGRLSDIHATSNGLGPRPENHRT